MSKAQDIERVFRAVKREIPHWDVDKASMVACVIVEKGLYNIDAHGDALLSRDPLVGKIDPRLLPPIEAGEGNVEAIMARAEAIALVEAEEAAERALHEEAQALAREEYRAKLRQEADEARSEWQRKARLADLGGEPEPADDTDADLAAQRTTETLAALAAQGIN